MSSSLVFIACEYVVIIHRNRTIKARSQTLLEHSSDASVPVLHSAGHNVPMHGKVELLATLKPFLGGNSRSRCEDDVFMSPVRCRSDEERAEARSPFDTIIDTITSSPLWSILSPRERSIVESKSLAKRNIFNAEDSEWTEKQEGTSPRSTNDESFASEMPFAKERFLVT